MSSKLKNVQLVSKPEPEDVVEKRMREAEARLKKNGHAVPPVKDFEVETKSGKTVTVEASTPEGAKKLIPGAKNVKLAKKESQIAPKDAEEKAPKGAKKPSSLKDGFCYVTDEWYKEVGRALLVEWTPKPGTAVYQDAQYKITGIASLTVQNVTANDKARAFLTVDEKALPDGFIVFNDDDTVRGYIPTSKVL